MPRASKVSRSGRRAPPQAQAALFVAETEKPLKAATCAQHLPFVNDAGRIKEAPSSVSGTFQMDQSLENRIRERAYEVWIAQGCVHGQADQHWLCSRAGNPGGINVRARQQIGPKKEAPVACTFEDRENARAGRLTPHIAPEMLAHTPPIQLSTSDIDPPAAIAPNRSGRCQYAFCSNMIICLSPRRSTA